MQTFNPDNERIKRRYFAYLREARRNSEATVDEAAKALHRFESHTRFRGFRKFHVEQAVAFKRHLLEQTGARSDAPLSRATVRSTLKALRGFFHWLAGQPGFRSRLSYSDAEYFNLSDKETRIARAHREGPVPSLEQIIHVLEVMPARSDIERRDRAVIALILLTGARDGAVASLRLKHLDLEDGCVVQDAREVHTKFSKTFRTWFFPVGGEVRAIVAGWAEHLRLGLLWGPDDPLFPATRVEPGPDRRFVGTGLDPRHWRNATPIRRIFREAFTAAGLPYFNPHSFRRTLAQLGERLCRTPEEFKAWSQNLGHEQVLTTFSSYGSVAAHRQAEIIRELHRPAQPEGLDPLDAIAQFVEAARRSRH